MNVIVHKDESGKNDLPSKIAGIHAEAVLRAIESLPCSLDQKLKILNKLIRSSRDI